eukprot:jgi/Mesen1/10044/ME000073S09324
MAGGASGAGAGTAGEVGDSEGETERDSKASAAGDEAAAETAAAEGEEGDEGAAGAAARARARARVPGAVALRGEELVRIQFNVALHFRLRDLALEVAHTSCGAGDERCLADLRRGRQWERERLPRVQHEAFWTCIGRALRSLAAQPSPFPRPLTPPPLPPLSPEEEEEEDEGTAAAAAADGKRGEEVEGTGARTGAGAAAAAAAAAGEGRFLMEGEGGSLLEGAGNDDDNAGEDGLSPKCRKELRETEARGGEGAVRGRARARAHKLNIFVATDSQKYRHLIVDRLRRYGDVYYSEGQVTHSANNRHASHLPTMAEFFLLSKSALIIGVGEISTFAEQAALFGNCTLVLLDVKGPRDKTGPPKCAISVEHQAILK